MGHDLPLHIVPVAGQGPRMKARVRAAKSSAKARRGAADGAERRAALVRALGEIVYDWRPTEDTIRWEGEIARLGCAADALGGDTASWTSRVHPEDLPRVLAEVEHARGQRRDYDLEYRFRHQLGHYLWMHDRGVLFLDADGRLERIVGVMFDISERKRAEQELRASERLRRLIFDTEPECVKVVSPAGQLLEINPAGLAMLEADSVAQAQGRPLAEFVAPRHQAGFANLHRRVMLGESGRLEFEVIGRRGTHRWLETHAVPMRDERGAVTALLGVTRDITERRRQDERIARLSRMREVMSAVNALIVRTRDRAELLQESCRIVVERGGFGLAWVALVQGDTMALVARHGEDGGCLQGARFSLDGAQPRDCHSAARAIRERQPVVCADVATDPALGYWREPLLALGYGSFVAYPLMAGGVVVGCLHLYAREPGFFDAEEMALLRELAGDLGYALEFIIKDQALDSLAIYDPLTQLANRSLFMRRLEGFIHAAQNSGRRLAVLMLDVERFKALNDVIGHDGGDALLRLSAERIKFHAGGAAHVARIAGDRFAAVMPELDRAVDLDTLVRNGAWDRLDPPFQHAGQEFPVTFKVGFAVFPQDGADAEALLRNAELALKQGKVSGRRHTRYAAEMSELATRKLQLDRELRLALDRGELQLHYQPKVDLRTGKVCGAEALLRWQSPAQGVVMPVGIVPLMEETGLIVEVGRWALARAAADREVWLREGMSVPRIGVNVSAAQLREKNFADSVRAALAEAPGAAAGLELEVTESMMMADPEASAATLQALRGLGFTVSMDDFGTGYSSLAYLTRLPLNSVKIDRSFIASMHSDGDTANIVSAIIALAHSLKLRVVAEGVETGQQLESLRRLRCDEMQGYLFSPSLPAAEFAALLRSGRTLG